MTTVKSHDTAELLLQQQNALALFPLGRTADENRKQYYDLLKQWHPDHCAHPQASAVTRHLTSLYKEMLKILAPVSIEFTDATGSHMLSFWSRCETEASSLLLGEQEIVLLFAEGCEDLATIYKHACTSFGYADARMRQQMVALLPQILATGTAEGRPAYRLAKEKDELLLADLLARAPQLLTAEQLAWIMSGALHLGCYLEYTRLAHQAITPDNLLVHPLLHTVRLVGGWGYATPYQQPLHALPSSALRFLLPAVQETKRATGDLDRTLIHELGLELLRHLALQKTVQGGSLDPVLSFLSSPPQPTALDDFNAWAAVRAQTWGQRRFIDWELSPSHLYPAAQQNKKG